MIAEQYMLKANYVALGLVVVDERLSIDNTVNALIEMFPANGKPKLGRPSKFSQYELMDMKKLLESGKTYNQVAKNYGLKRGDNVYQMLRSYDMLPDRIKAKK